MDSRSPIAVITGFDKSENLNVCHEFYYEAFKGKLSMKMDSKFYLLDFESYSISQNRSPSPNIPNLPILSDFRDDQSQSSERWTNNYYIYENAWFAAALFLF